MESEYHEGTISLSADGEVLGTVDVALTVQRRSTTDADEAERLPRSERLGAMTYTLAATDETLAALGFDGFLGLNADADTRAHLSLDDGRSGNIRLWPVVGGPRDILGRREIRWTPEKQKDFVERTDETG